MNRKDFLASLTVLAAGPACCAQTASASAPQGTPLDRKYSFCQIWAKRMIDLLDQQLDPAARTQLMHTMGRVCFEGAHGKVAADHKAKAGDLDRMLEMLRKFGGPDMVRREGDVIHFQYIGNPAGLKVADGYCLCPVVEKGPEGLSGTYCECSVGYVTEMFSRASEVPVKVQLLESLKRGGKTCRFRIELQRA